MTRQTGEYEISDLQKEIKWAKQYVTTACKGRVYFDSPVFYPTSCGMSLRLDYKVAVDNGDLVEGSYGCAL